jgi:hypothetical protein
VHVREHELRDVRSLKQKNTKEVKSSRVRANSRCLHPIHRGQPPSSAAAYCDTQTARHIGRTHDRVWWSLCASQISKVSKRDSRSTREGEASNTCVQSRVLPLPTRSICLSLSHAQAHYKRDRRPMRALHSDCMALPRGQPKFCQTGVHCHSNIEGPYAPKW